MRALPHTVRTMWIRILGSSRRTSGRSTALTVSLGIRFDYHANSFPEQTLGPTLFTPNRNITFPAADNLSYKDITPKSQFVYDLFGNGKTALKLSFNKYLTGLGTTNGVTPVTLGPNPINTLNTSVSRSWTDGNNNFNPGLQSAQPAGPEIWPRGGDSCGRSTTRPSDGRRANTVFDPDLLTAGGSGSTTGSSRQASSMKFCRASRWMSSTSAAGTATSSSRTTGPWRRRTSTRSA